MKSHFLATSSINIKIGRAGKARILLEQTQWLSILPESSQKSFVLFSGKLNHPQLRDHDRPAEDGSNREKRQDELARHCRVFEREKQTACRNQFRNQHARFTCVLINDE